MTQHNFTVGNQYGQTLVIYSTMSEPVTDPPSTDATKYYPVYTKLGTVEAGETKGFATDNILARIVAARAADEFPIKLAILDFIDSSPKSFIATADDGKLPEAAWKFYKSFASQPYAPLSLQFYGLVNNTDPAKLNAKAAKFFNYNGYPGVDFGMFSMVGYWAANSLYSFPGKYWCYEPQGSTEGFILPRSPSGTIIIAEGAATYQATGGSPVSLAYARNKLSVPGASAGVELTGIVRDLTWEGNHDQVVMCFSGTNAGTRMIAQPYQDPPLPWYAVAYDLVYLGFTLVNYAMMVDMAVHTLSSVTNGLKFLAQNIGKFADTVRGWVNNLGENAAPETGIGGDIDPINVDVDVDVDIDVDVDVDIDIDIDVDVDVDIDIDVDVDFGVVVDVDVDVDIDVDIDVVTDTETDIDIDVDIDIDTDVNVQSGMVRSFLDKLGNWLLTKAVPSLVQNLVIYAEFQAADKLLQVWKNADEQGIKDLQPREATGLGLLVNYMLNEKNSPQTRWDTFADYAAQPNMDSGTLQMTVTSVLMTQNQAADTAAKNWRWSEQDKNAAKSAMGEPGPANAYQAFHTLGGYTYQGNSLPVKVAGQVAMAYLKSWPAGSNAPSALGASRG